MPRRRFRNRATYDVRAPGLSSLAHQSTSSPRRWNHVCDAYCRSMFCSASRFFFQLSSLGDALQCSFQRRHSATGTLHLRARPNSESFRSFLQRRHAGVLKAAQQRKDQRTLIPLRHSTRSNNTAGTRARPCTCRRCASCSRGACGAADRARGPSPRRRRRPPLPPRRPPPFRRGRPSTGIGRRVRR